MTTPDVVVDPDPFRNRREPAPVAGEGFGRLVQALRDLQDAVTSTAPADDKALDAAERLAAISAELNAYEVGEWDRFAGRRPDLPGRGNPMLPPVVIRHEESGWLEGTVVFARSYLGGNGAVHGGNLPLMFDDVIGRLVNASGGDRPSRTAYLHVNYRHITPIEKELRVEASVDKVEGRKRFASGRLYDGETLVSDAEGLFVELRAGQP